MNIEYRMRGAGQVNIEQMNIEYRRGALGLGEYRTDDQACTKGFEMNLNCHNLGEVQHW